MQVVDARGFSCPQPLVMFHQALKEYPNEDLDVLVDNPASQENVTRAASNKGFSVKANNENDGSVRLEIRKS